MTALLVAVTFDDGHEATSKHGGVNDVTDKVAQIIDDLTDDGDLTFSRIVITPDDGGS